eukprot:2039090-Prymnesium_polylepis.1
MCIRDRERQTKHDRLRQHVKWLTATRFQGKQARLAEQLNVASRYLSEYMTGKKKGGNLSLSQLATYHSNLMHYLRLHDLPTDIPTAASAATAATAAAETAQAETARAETAAAKPPKPSAAAPVFAAKPKAAVLTVSLADVGGWREGGDVHILALGVPVLGDCRWVLPCPGDETSALQLRVGLRGRRTLSPRSHASVAGRTFE